MDSVLAHGTMLNMKVAVTGAGGMLGSDICAVFKSRGILVYPLLSSHLDIRNITQIHTVLTDIKPDVLINCAAYTAVDRAETDVELATLINGTSVGYLAAYCAEHHCRFIHFSTDYVFNGQKDTPYVESDASNPINVYGKSKLDGEAAILHSAADAIIFRVQWLYGKHGPNFISTMKRLGSERPSLTVVADQWGAPTWTIDIAEAVFASLSHHLPSGIYHYSSEGYTHWADVARRIMSCLGLECQIHNIPTDDYPTPAKRPLNSRLDCQLFSSFISNHRYPWHEQISAFLQQ